VSTLADGRLTVAVVTSDSEENARRALGPLVSCISHFACGASLFGKARKFRQVMRAAGISAEATLAVGDEVRDAEAAKAAGIDFAGVAWGYATADALARVDPVAIFASVSEMRAWLCRAVAQAPTTGGNVG
jgi:phosphoglycolate phosphatase